MSINFDDIIHANAVLLLAAAVYYSGSGVNKAIVGKESVDKIYDCFCYVISNAQEYGCTEVITRNGLNITQACAAGGELRRMQVTQNEAIFMRGCILAGFSIILGIAIAILFLRPCARYREYAASRSITSS